MDPEVKNDSIFWIEVNRINPNPFQPRKEFNEDRLRDLADSIRQYGVLQPLVVTRKEVEKENGGLEVEYELIAGERRLRAAKIAGIFQVPAVIKTGDQTDKMKLEMAIIENLQREDLNPVDRARAFAQLATEFALKHSEIGKKIGKSREYVSNSIRILALPQEVLEALMAGEIMEGHTRPILMLTDRPEEQTTLFKEIKLKRLTVREAEDIARRIAFDRVRKLEKFVEPEIVELENRLAERFGSRVKVEKWPSGAGGHVKIDFITQDDLKHIVEMMYLGANNLLDEELSQIANETDAAPADLSIGTTEGGSVPAETPVSKSGSPETGPKTDSGSDTDEELYSLKNFTI